jgi:hypothetical protein
MERSKLITIYANDLLHCQVIGDTIDEILGACRHNLPIALKLISCLPGGRGCNIQPVVTEPADSPVS